MNDLAQYSGWLKAKKIALLLGFLALLGAFFALDLQSRFDLEYFQSQREAILAYKDANFWQSSLAYFALYVAATAFSLPVAAALTLIGGAVFGFAWALVMVSFASAIGATLAFLLARTLLRDWVQSRFGEGLQPINRGIEKDGALYLFTLRLIPVFPFFLVNVLMALTPISTVAFYLASQLGMLLGTALYVNVGAQLGQAASLPEIFSLDVIGAIAILAVFPWAAKGALAWLRKRKIKSSSARPRSFAGNEEGKGDD